MNDAHPQRPGTRPATSSVGPHRQLEQKSPPQVWGMCAARLFSLPGVSEGHSSVSIASSRALLLAVDEANGPPEAFLGGTEFAHLHDVFDTSVHLCLPLDRAQSICALGWGEPHGYAEQGTEIMVYAPRDEDEIEIVLAIVAESLAFARGDDDR